MTRKFPTAFGSFCALITPVCVLPAVIAFLVVMSGPSAARCSYQPGPCVWGCNVFLPPAVLPAGPAQTPAPTQALSIGLTQVGSPIWKPGDFQLFTAPAAPFPDGFLGTLDQMLPLEGPGIATYTPHPGPYNTELSTNRAAAGFVNQQVFQQSAITFDPNGVFFMYMMLPDPGVTGSSRDFASGPIIPNSLFPITSNATMWLDGAKVETLQDNLLLNVRNGDLPYEGQSHRAPSQAVWYPWADSNAGPLGSHELRMTLRDNQGNGWDISAPFAVVPEPSSLAIVLGGASSLALCLARKRKVLRMAS